MDFKEGDRVQQKDYGLGTVVSWEKWEEFWDKKEWSCNRDIMIPVEWDTHSYLEQNILYVNKKDLKLIEDRVPFCKVKSAKELEPYIGRYVKVWKYGTACARLEKPHVREIKSWYTPSCIPQQGLYFRKNAMGEQWAMVKNCEILPKNFETMKPGTGKEFKCTAKPPIKPIIDLQPGIVYGCDSCGAMKDEDHSPKCKYVTSGVYIPTSEDIKRVELQEAMDDLASSNYQNMHNTKYWPPKRTHYN